MALNKFTSIDVLKVGGYLARRKVEDAATELAMGVMRGFTLGFGDRPSDHR
ncbi:hypothetical protein [Serratia sp. D1N4]